MVGHLHNLQSDPPGKPSIHLAPYIVITIIDCILYAVLYVPVIGNNNNNELKSLSREPLIHFVFKHTTKESYCMYCFAIFFSH